jgi:hypothetical protein
MTHRQVQMKTRLIFASIILQILTVPLWADWTACDIGSSGNIGVQIQITPMDKPDGTLNFTLSAGGAPLADKTDGLGFASAPAKMKGDCEIMVQVVSISPGKQDWAAGGVMVRENFSAGSKFFAAAFTRGHGIQNFVRTADSAAVTAQENCSDCSPPSWLKIVRQGNHFTSYKSMDGRIWLEISEADVPMKKNAWVGVFTTGGGGATGADVTFARVTTRENAGQ